MSEKYSLASWDVLVPKPVGQNGHKERPCETKNLEDDNVTRVEHKGAAYLAFFTTTQGFRTNLCSI